MGFSLSLKSYYVLTKLLNLLDKRRFDGILPELEKFTIEKVKDLEGW